MSTTNAIATWIQGLRSSDAHQRDAAASALWDCFARQLQSVARRCLSPRIRQREDEQDVLQDTYRSFFAQVQCGQLQPASRDDLWRVLITMTVNKSRSISARHLRHKRSVAHEQGMHGNDPQPAERCPLDHVQDHTSSAEELAVFNDTLQRLLATLESPVLQQILRWKLEGFTNEEIAGKLDCTERTVERKLQIIRLRYAELEG